MYILEPKNLKVYIRLRQAQQGKRIIKKFATNCTNYTNFNTLLIDFKITLIQTLLKFVEICVIRGKDPLKIV